MPDKDEKKPMTMEEMVKASRKAFMETGPEIIHVLNQLWGVETYIYGQFMVAPDGNVHVVRGHIAGFAQALVFIKRFGMPKDIFIGMHSDDPSHQEEGEAPLAPLETLGNFDISDLLGKPQPEPGAPDDPDDPDVPPTNADPDMLS